MDPSSVVYHKNAISLPMHTHRKYYLNHRNSLLMLLSNYSLPVAFYIGTIRAMLEFVALGYALIKFDYRHASGIIRSAIWILLHPHTIIKKRYWFSSIRKVKDKNLFKNMCKTPIVLAHYLFGKNTYPEIELKAD